MKKFIFIVLIMNHLFAKEVTLQDFASLPIIQEKEIQVTSFTPMNELYIVEGTKETNKGKRDIKLFVSKDFKYTFFGRVYNNITAEEVYIKKSPLAYKEKANFTFGSGKEEYYLFTDPECPFCKKFEEILLKSGLQKRVKIHYFLYPLPMHKNAVAMSSYILSQKDKHKAVENIMLKNSKEYTKTVVTEKITKIIKENKRVAKELGVRGTPKLLKPDGTRVDTQEFFRINK